MTKDLAHPDRPRPELDDHRAVLRGDPASISRRRWRRRLSRPDRASARRPASGHARAGSRGRSGRPGSAAGAGSAAAGAAIHGGRTIGTFLRTTRSISRFCAVRCIAWMIRVGSIRRRCTRQSSAIDVLLPSRHRPGEDVRRGDRVLDGEVDADPADRRHGMGGVADREQAGPVPGRQPVELDGQQLDLVPARSSPTRRPGTARSRRRRRGNRRRPLLAQRLRHALGEDIGALPIIAAVDQGEQPAGLDHAGGPRCRRVRSFDRRNQNTSIGAPRSSSGSAARSRSSERGRRRRGPASRAIAAPSQITPATRSPSHSRSVASALHPQREAG